MTDTTIDKIRQLKALADEQAVATFTNLAAAAQEATLTLLLHRVPEADLVRAGLESVLTGQTRDLLAEDEVVPLLIELMEKLLPLYKRALGVPEAVGGRVPPILIDPPPPDIDVWGLGEEDEDEVAEGDQ